jgi:release factor glutamine methyltransferase
MRDLIHATAGRLSEAGLDEARLKAELLIAHTLGVRRLEIYIESRRPPMDELDRLVARALQGEPLQYVLGHVDFRGRRFTCDARALIPRPETEQLVDLVLADETLKSGGPVRVADVGTGTGCIAISLALAHPRFRCLATDISEEALALARENAAALGAGRLVEFRCCDLLCGVEAGSLDAIISNPPYVPSDEMQILQAEVRRFEPRLALDGGPSGLEIVDRLLPQAFGALRRGGRLFLEIGENQGPALIARMTAGGWRDIRVEHDLAGHDRFAMGVKP